MYGEILAALRKDQGYTQDDIAQYLHISISSVSNYENSVHYPSFEILVQLCNLYEVSADYILERTKTSIEINKLNTEMGNGYTLGNCLELMITSDKIHREHMLDYFEMTQPRFRMLRGRKTKKKT